MSYLRSKEFASLRTDAMCDVSEFCKGGKEIAPQGPQHKRLLELRRASISRYLIDALPKDLPECEQAIAIIQERLDKFDCDPARAVFEPLIENAMCGYLIRSFNLRGCDMTEYARKAVCDLDSFSERHSDAIEWLRTSDCSDLKERFAQYSRDVRKYANM